MPSTTSWVGTNIKVDKHEIHKKEQTERALYWHYPHYHGSGWTPGGAIRKGDWKLIEFWEYDDVELYDLSKDIGEQNDLSKQHPEKVRELQLALDKWRMNIHAVMPVRAKKLRR